MNQEKVVQNNRPRQNSAPLVNGILQRTCACGQHTYGGAQCKECSKTKRTSQFGAPLQAKLTISKPGDFYEQEADRIADEVMRMPGPLSNSARLHGETATKDTIHRSCAPCAKEHQSSVLEKRAIEPSNLCPQCREKKLPNDNSLVQRRVVGDKASNVEVPPTVYEVLSSSGQPLDSKTRGYMESRFGHDFSRVRVHADAVASESAQVVNAHAYTVGHDVVFGPGQYTPATGKGKKLIAHELAHVVQQGGVNTDSGAHNTGFPTTGLMQLDPAPRPTSENIWGLRITRTMCSCRQRVRDGISWANTAGATYAACDVPANATGTDVEACFDAAQPGTTVAGSTSASGTMTLPPATADPCERIENKGTFVHETMHARHANAIARARGTAFFREWRRLAGDPNRLDTLRATFPAQVAAFETQWNNGHDWAQDEVNSYKWERRFLVDALGALNRIC